MTYLFNSSIIRTKLSRKSKNKSKGDENLPKDESLSEIKEYKDNNKNTEKKDLKFAQLWENGTLSMDSTSTIINFVDGCCYDSFKCYDYTISIDNIAHALCRIPRWAGSVPIDWTVGDHSLMVCNLLCLCDLETQMLGLLHDSVECLIGDIPRPIKHKISWINDLEEMNFFHILDCLGLKKLIDLYPKYAHVIKVADNDACKKEIDVFFLGKSDFSISESSFSYRKSEFITKFNYLKQKIT